MFDESIQLKQSTVPYSSFGYWESTQYHLGLEDDNDLGLKYSYHRSAGVGNKTLQNLLGCTLNTNAITTYIKLISGVNYTFNGPGVGLAD